MYVHTWTRNLPFLCEQVTKGLPPGGIVFFCEAILGVVGNVYAAVVVRVVIGGKNVKFADALGLFSVRDRSSRVRGLPASLTEGDGAREGSGLFQG